MLKLLFMIGLLMAYSTVRAADYRLMCSVEEIGAKKAASTYKIWLEFDIEPRYFKHFIQDGNAIKRVREGFPQDVDDNRILIVNDGVMQEHYDRKDKKYFYINDSTGIEISGGCVPRTAR